MLRGVCESLHRNILVVSQPDAADCDSFELVLLELHTMCATHLPGEVVEPLFNMMRTDISSTKRAASFTDRSVGRVERYYFPDTTSFFKSCKPGVAKGFGLAEVSAGDVNSDDEDSRDSLHPKDALGTVLRRLVLDAAWRSA